MIKTLQKRAFTLIELLVVIAIIGILASLIIVSLSGARSKATDTQLKNNARNIDTALAQYYQDNNSKFPAMSAATSGGVAIDSTELSELTAYFGSSNSTAFNHSDTDAKYITDDQNAASDYYAQAWSLKSTTESAITAANGGNGVYGLNQAIGLCTAVAGKVCPGNFANLTGAAVGNALTGMAATYTSATRAFVTYGPQ